MDGVEEGCSRASRWRQQDKVQSPTAGRRDQKEDSWAEKRRLSKENSRWKITNQKACFM
jgi:hypothetical protein